MNFTEYQMAAKRTMGGFKSQDKQIVCAMLGLNGEAGEAADMVKKYMFQEHCLNLNELALEAGDCLWYLALLADAIGMSLDEIAKRNIEKLTARYPDGFSAEKSINRTE